MENSKKKSLIGTSLYIVLAFCVLALIGVGVFSALKTTFKSESAPEIIPKTIIDSKKLEGEIPNTNIDIGQNAVFEPELVPEEPVTNVTEEIPTPAVAFVRPVAGKITKDFSKDTLVFSQTMKDYRTHGGIDFACEVGEPVKCFTDGTIEEFVNDPLTGMTMVVSHAGEIKTRYTNLSQDLPENIEVGKLVTSGEEIAYVGSPGLLECGEPIHLHFEIEKSGKNIGLEEFTLS